VPAIEGLPGIRENTKKRKKPRQGAFFFNAIYILVKKRGSIFAAVLDGYKYILAL
jgi:hypothetical protein